MKEIKEIKEIEEKIRENLRDWQAFLHDEMEEDPNIPERWEGVEVQGEISLDIIFEEKRFFLYIDGASIEEENEAFRVLTHGLPNYDDSDIDISGVPEGTQTEKIIFHVD